MSGPSRSFESVNAQSISNIPIVGPSGFDTLAAALTTVTDGEMILMTKSTQETGTVIDKSVRIMATNAARRRPNDEKNVAIESSGGDGPSIISEGVTIDGVASVGDGTGGFGWALRENGLTMRDCVARGHGTDGVLVDQSCQNHKTEITTVSNGRHGIYFNLDNANAFYSASEVWLNAFDNTEDGIRTANSNADAIFGNEFRLNELANNDGWDWYHEDGGRFQDNIIRGYGFEPSSNSGSIHMVDTDGRGGNEMRVFRVPDPVTRDAIWDTWRTTEDEDERFGTRDTTVDYALYDDWGDGYVTNRNRRSRGNYIADNGIITGYVRPDWGGGTVTNGAYRLSNGAFRTAPSNHDTGYWEVDWEFVSDPTSGFLFIEFLLEDADNRVEVLVGHGGTHRLRYQDGGATTDLVNGSKPDDTNRHTTRVERDRDGNWELFLDGSSQGTATDAFLPTVSSFRFEFSADADCDIHQIRCQ